MYNGATTEKKALTDNSTANEDFTETIYLCNYHTIILYWNNLNLYNAEGSYLIFNIHEELFYRGCNMKSNYRVHTDYINTIQYTAI